jgi:ferritin-like metal-binding protein YciE
LFHGDARRRQVLSATRRNLKIGRHLVSAIAAHPTKSEQAAAGAATGLDAPCTAPITGGHHGSICLLTYREKVRPVSSVAEKKILATLPKMAKAAQSPDLKNAFEKHRGETEGHVARLEKVFGAIDKRPQAKTCDAIVGITDEGAEIMKEYMGSPALDAGLLAAAQAVEHYEISRYGTLRTWARELGLNDAVRLLDQTLDEEKKTDATLTKIAEAAVNQQAEAA